MEYGTYSYGDNPSSNTDGPLSCEFLIICLIRLDFAILMKAAVSNTISLLFWFWFSKSDHM